MIVPATDLKPQRECKAGDCDIVLQMPRKICENLKKLLKKLTRVHPRCRCDKNPEINVVKNHLYMKNFDSFRRDSPLLFEENDDVKDEVLPKQDWKSFDFVPPGYIETSSKAVKPESNMNESNTQKQPTKSNRSAGPSKKKCK